MSAGTGATPGNTSSPGCYFYLGTLDQSSCGAGGAGGGPCGSGSGSQSASQGAETHANFLCSTTIGAGPNAPGRYNPVLSDGNVSCNVNTAVNAPNWWI